MKPTKLLAETAVKWADEYELDYEITLENTVVLFQIPLETRAGEREIDLFVFDRNPGMSFLAIVAFNLARFPDTRIDRALDICDRLNRACMGKFVTAQEPDADDRMALYCVECPIVDGADYEVFKRTIENAISWIEAAYPALMLARYGDMSVDRAYDMWLGKEAAPDAPEEGGASIMTDEEIRRLMGED